MIAYGAGRQRRYVINQDGRTAHESINGRRPQNQIVEFGEKVWWRPLQPSSRRLGDQEPRFEDGYFLGPLDGSIAVLVGTADSDVVQARALKRRPATKRWEKEGVLAVKHCKVQPNGAASEDQCIKIRALVEFDPVAEEELPAPLPASLMKLRDVQCLPKGIFNQRM